MTKGITQWGSKLLLGGTLLLASAVPWQTASADRLMNENFDYPIGTLLADEGWLKYATTHINDKLAVLEGNLTYPLYQELGIGGKIHLNNTNLGEDLMKTFTDNAAIKSGSVYAAFIINVSEAPDDTSAATYFFNFLAGTKNGVVTGGSNGEYGRVFVVKGSTDNTVKVGISRGDANIHGYTPEFNIGEDVLVVVKYEIVSGVTNDKVSVWLNPVITANEPAADASYNDQTGNDASTNYGIQGVELRQGQTGTKKAAVLDIDALRVGTEWADLFDEFSAVDSPIISVSNTEVSAYTYQGMPVSQKVNIQGQSLTGDITVDCGEGLTADKTVIPMADAMSEDGVDVVFTMTPQVPGSVPFTATLNSEGADPLNVNFNITVSPCTAVSSLADFANITDAGNYRYTGKAVVTAIVPDTYGFTMYAQDEQGAIVISGYSDGECPYAVGDQFTGGIGYAEIYLGAPTRELGYTAACMPEVLEHNVQVDAKVVSVSDFTAAFAKANVYRLVQVNDVAFSVEEGTKFSTSFIDAKTLQDQSFKVKSLAGSDLIGTDVPSGKVNLTGISSSASVLSLALRSTADVESSATVPSLVPDRTYVRMEAMLQGASQQASVTLTATDLEGDVTITCPSTIVCDKASLTKEEVMAEGGVTLNFTVTPLASGEYTGKVTLKSEGAEDVEIEFYVPEVTKVITVANSTAIMNQLDDPELEDNFYKYTGKAVITYIESISSRGGDYKKYYAQDMFGGLCFSTQYAGIDPGFKVGDEITNSYGVILTEMKAPVFYMMPADASGALAEVSAEGKTKTPVTVQISEITATTAEQYIYRLVKLEGVQFVPADGQTTFDDSSISITDGSNTAQAKAFTDAQIIGTEIPAGDVTVTGISRSIQSFVLGLCNSSDIEVGAASVEITPEKLFDFTNNAAPVGEKTEIYKFTVVAQNLKAEAPITITGTDFAYFSVTPSYIPAGSSTTEVTVYYEPETTGMHKANIMFDFDGTSAELNQSKSLGTCKAYDPQNMPTVTITPAEVELIAKPGEKVTAEVKLTGEGCFDYITGARQGTGDNGGITVSSTYMLPDSYETPITVTFQPKAEGEFTETFVYTTTLCATPATLTIKGICRGEVEPEPTQGQEFILSEENPYVWYTQDFMDVEKNTPLAIDGWVNSALEGQRAWWGYVENNDEEAFHAAKCTAYDSMIASGKGLENQQMILVSPALDYKNSKIRTLKFDLMGMYLTEDSGDVLDICMVEMENGSPVVYPMQGFNVPTTSDEAGTWIPYEVDMTAIPDMPDTFFIAFRFNYTRGSDNATTYYITNFEWGDKSNGLNSISSDAMFAGAKADADGLYSVYNMQGMLLMRTASAADLQKLPAGIYIVGGKKIFLK